MADNETFGKRLARLRKKAGITQEKLAEMLDVSYMTVRRWDWGKNAPRLDEAKRIAAALNVSEEELLNGAPEQGGWVLQIKIATEIKEKIIDMRANKVPTISELTCTPSGGGFTLYGDYELWTDKKKVKALIKQLLAGRDLILANGKALGGIKEEK
ncbi:MAG: helix-turn-helix transcriptional regulator [Synergistaceae bacterium]|nr:helix-turn-helix transcriptional regulator [Synergistaceae bacterium]